MTFDPDDPKSDTKRIPVWWHQLPAVICRCPDAEIEVVRQEKGYSGYVFRHLRCRSCGESWRDHLEDAE